MHCNVCYRYRKFKKTKTSNIFYKTLSLSTVSNKCGHKYEKKKYLKKNNQY